MPKPKPHTYLAVARSFYGPAFEHREEHALADSMAEWAEMDEDEQAFAMAHLSYLQLQAQAVTQRLLVQVRDLLDEVAESLNAALEASLPDGDPLDEEPVFPDTETIPDQADAPAEEE